ncbi:MAG: hypothetical protein JJU10_07440 [Idiomarina sp.]|nr:hypothetical protein [Idiomarina sp.]
MRWLGRVLAVCCGALLCADAFASTARIASLSLCHDALLERWLPAEQPRLLSHEIGRRGERLLAFQPHLVLVTPFNSPTLVRFVERQGVPLYRLSHPIQLSDAKAELLRLGDALDVADAAAAEVVLWDAELARLASMLSGTFIAYQPNNWSWGTGNLLHDVLSKLGLENVGLGDEADAGRVMVRMTPEQIVWQQPDWLFLEGRADSFALAHVPQRHAVFSGWQKGFLPPEISGCLGQELPAMLKVLADMLEREE